jgi:hypothetical protein
MQAETRVTMPPSKVLAKGVDLVAIWLDMGSRYKPDVEIHREDFTMALESISVSPPPPHHPFHHPSTCMVDRPISAVAVCLPCVLIK